MPIFEKSSHSLFETLGRSRQEVLGKKPVIPPPGTLARPGMPKIEPPKKGPRVQQMAIERAVDDLLDVDGDPILVVDDELDVESITAEDAIVDEEPPRLLGVRADTAVVFGIGLVLVVAIAYFAGRTTKKDVPSVAAAPETAKPPAVVLKPPVQVVEKIVAEKEEEPAPPPPVVEKKPVVVDGNFEILVVTTTEEKAAAVADYLNNDMRSPVYGKGFTAYVKNGQVRIKGFDKKDEAILSSVKDMRDPTGGGRFKDANFRKISKK